MNNDFYTLTTYLHENKDITYAMEDYLEMLYRNLSNKNSLTITKLSSLLHIKKSSCSKMISKLKSLGYVYIEDNFILLTKKGNKIGSYLLYRHNTISNFLKLINKEDYTLNQVEKIEHFIDNITLLNIKKATTILKDNL